MKPVKVLIACGGSGGHIFPGIALREALVDLDKGCGIFLVTSDRRIDTQILREERFSYAALPYNPFPYSLSPLKIFKFLVKLAKAIFISLSLLKNQGPDCVVGLGGYVSGPLVFTARLMRRRVLIHEQNIVPSLTNRFSAAFADKICVTFDKTKDYFRKKAVVKTGNPIRYNFLKQYAGSSGRALGLESDRFTILVMGGSQGSTFLNDSFKKAMCSMDSNQKRKIQVLHLTGEKDFSVVKQDYEKAGVNARVWPFLDKVGYAYDAAGLIISRAGATALSEITAFGKPSILIPYPEPRIHQRENAEFFSDHGASLFIEEKDLTPEYLKDTVLELMEDSERLRHMADEARALGIPDAAYRLAREVLGLANRYRTSQNSLFIKSKIKNQNAK